MLIYKILRRPEWDAFRAAGETAGAPVDVADGFILACCSRPLGKVEVAV